MSNGGWSNQTSRRLVLVVGSVYSGIFFYDPTVGHGNLIVSLVPAAGTDPYNNSYAQGLTIGASGGDQVVIGLTGGQPLIYFPTGAANITNASAIQTIRQNGSGDAGYDQIQLLGAENTVQNDSVLSTWLASSTDGTQDPQIQDYYHDPSGVFHLYRLLSFRGDVIEAGAITAVDPTTGLSRANPAKPEAWHTAILGTGWATPARQPLSYRLTPDGNLHIAGNCTSTSSTPAAIVFTLPAGWRPLNSLRIGVGAFPSTGNPETVYSVNVSSTGAVTINSPSVAATGVELDFSHLIPMNL